MIVGNIVKEVLAYKKGQIQQKLSSPQAFVSSRFQEKLQSEPAKETKGTLYRLENSTKNTVRLMLENEEIGTGKILTKNGKMYVEIVELKR